MSAPVYGVVCNRVWRCPNRVAAQEQAAEWDSTVMVSHDGGKTWRPVEQVES